MTGKIATCCYCGVKAALTLQGKSRHELACASCGAPLHNLKQFPTRPAGAAPATPSRPPAAQQAHPKVKGYAKRKPNKKRKTLARKVFSELWDVVEDIFD